MPSLLTQRAAVVTENNATTLYVLDVEGSQGALKVYEDGGGSFLRTILPAATGPVSYTIDNTGRLYASALDGHAKLPGRLNIYVNRGARFIRNIKQRSPFAWPTVDNGGNLYSTCPGDQICERAGAKSQITRKFKHIEGPLATDSVGDLVAYRCSQLEAEACVFAPGQSTAYWTITSGAGYPGVTGFTFDPQGNLYAANFGGSRPADPGSISVYAPLAASPTRVISTGIAGPLAIATDAQGSLYVYNRCAGSFTSKGACTVKGGSITVYHAGQGSPTRTVTNGILGDGPYPWVGYGTPLAVDSAGNIYVANQHYPQGNVTVYGLGSDDPVRKITNLENPIAVAVGS